MVAGVRPAWDAAVFPKVERIGRAFHHVQLGAATGTILQFRHPIFGLTRVVEVLLFQVRQNQYDPGLAELGAVLRFDVGGRLPDRRGRTLAVGFMIEEAAEAQLL